jgi:hypothetical protein
MAPRKIRPRGALPANWKFRDGRPRWEPGPGLRAAGWRGHDLKDAAGRFLSQGASIDVARSINQAVAAWRSGALVPADYAQITPAGACLQVGGGLPIAMDKLAIGRLIEAYTGAKDGHPRPSAEFAKLKPSTQRDYRGKLKRLVDVLAGYVALPPKADAKAQAAYAAGVAEIRAASILILEPIETARGIEDPLHAAYWRMHAELGAHQAAGVLTVASVWLSWCRERQSRQIRNWAAEVSRETPPGRIRVGTWEELAALVAAAEALGYPSIADSIILGVDLSWSQADRLGLTWDRVRDGRCFTGAAGRVKTGRVGGTPLSSLGLRRIAAIRARQKTWGAQPTHVLICETTKAPWLPSHYSHTFLEVRREAAKSCPTAIDLKDQDLRDTALTVARNAGLTNDQLASRSLQSRAQINTLMDRHYGQIGPEIADQGKALLDAYLEEKKVAL